MAFGGNPAPDYRFEWLAPGFFPKVVPGFAPSWKTQWWVDASTWSCKLEAFTSDFKKRAGDTGFSWCGISILWGRFLG
jgi:hypothetical protein